MQASDVMTTEVITVQPQTSVLEAVRLMLQHKISGLPVTDSGGHLVGILTEGDFLRRAETGTTRNRPRWLEFLVGPGRLAEEYAHSHGRKVGEVMTPDPTTVAEQTPLADIVDLMERRRIKRVPVTRGDALVGIISRSNLVRALAGLARKGEPASPTDAGIREQILAVLRNETWAPSASIQVTVHQGVADLWGAILDERMRSGLIVAIENVPGVTEVRDHLAWVEPTSGLVVESPDARRFGET
jgi:CBS domain-containing protein